MSPTLFQSGIKNVNFGQDVKLVEPVNIYGCAIGDNCFVGPFVEIQKDVNIGKRTKIQSHTFICELVSIGDDCFVGHFIAVADGAVADLAYRHRFIMDFVFELGAAVGDAGGK